MSSHSIPVRPSPLKQSTTQFDPGSPASAPPVRSHNTMTEREYPASLVLGKKTVPVHHETFRTALEHFVQGAQIIEEMFHDKFETAHRLCTEVIMPYQNSGYTNMDAIYNHTALSDIIERAIAARLVFPPITDELYISRDARYKEARDHLLNKLQARVEDKEEDLDMEDTEATFQVGCDNHQELDDILDRLDSPKVACGGHDGAFADWVEEALEADTRDELDKVLDSMG